MIWIMSESCMCSGLLNASANGIDLRTIDEQPDWTIGSIENEFVKTWEIDWHPANQPFDILTTPREERVWTPDNIAKFEHIRDYAQNHGCKSMVCRWTDDKRFIDWAERMGDTMVWIRRIDISIPSIMRRLTNVSAVKYEEKDIVDQVCNWLMSRLHTDIDKPFVDQADFMVANNSIQLDKVFANFDHNKHTENLRWWYRKNFMGIRDNELINDILLQSHWRTKSAGF